MYDNYTKVSDGYICNHPNKGDCKIKFPFLTQTETISTGNATKHLLTHNSKDGSIQTVLISREQKNKIDNALLKIIYKDLEFYI